MKLAAYTRVSTDRQAEQGLGLDVQRDAIQKWSNAEGHRIVLWASDEGVSGSNGLDARVGLLDALGALQAGEVQGVVVYRLDRLARDLVLQESLLAEVWRASGRVFSTSASEDAYLDPEGADADPSRALIRQILGAVAQYERSMIRLRLRSGKVRKAEAGGYVGGAPALGWRAEDRALVKDEQEQLVRQRILELRAEGQCAAHEGWHTKRSNCEQFVQRSLREIGSALDAEGLKPKRSERWHPEKVRAALQRQN